MLSNGVHHDAERQDMAAHDEDGEEQLANSEQLTAERAQQDFSCIGKVLDVRVALVELRDDIAGVCGQETQADDKDQSTVDCQLLFQSDFIKTHGARPS